MHRPLNCDKEERVSGLTSGSHPSIGRRCSSRSVFTGVLGASRFCVTRRSPLAGRFTLAAVSEITGVAADGDGETTGSMPDAATPMTPMVAAKPAAMLAMRYMGDSTV